MVDVIVCLAQGDENVEELRVVHGNVKPHEISAGLSCKGGTESRCQKADNYNPRKQSVRQRHASDGYVEYK